MEWNWRGKDTIDCEQPDVNICVTVLDMSRSKTQDATNGRCCVFLFFDLQSCSNRRAAGEFGENLRSPDGWGRDDWSSRGK